MGGPPTHVPCCLWGPGGPQRPRQGGSGWRWRGGGTGTTVPTEEPWPPRLRENHRQEKHSGVSHVLAGSENTVQKHVWSEPISGVSAADGNRAETAHFASFRWFPETHSPWGAPTRRGSTQQSGRGGGRCGDSGCPGSQGQWGPGLGPRRRKGHVLCPPCSPRWHYR